jgi:hypothetical protein
MDLPHIGNKIPLTLALAALWPTAVSAQSIINISGTDLLAVGPAGAGQEAVVGIVRFVFGLIFVFFVIQLIAGMFMAQTHGDNEEARQKMIETFKSAVGGMAVCLLLIVMASSLVDAAYAAASLVGSPIY